MTHTLSEVIKMNNMNHRNAVAKRRNASKTASSEQNNNTENKAENNTQQN